MEREERRQSAAGYPARPPVLSATRPARDPRRLAPPRRRTRALRLVPDPAVEPARALDLLAGRGGHLSFRTVSVLRVIAAEPGLSNKQVALRAGMRDEGQASRVLGRLSRLGVLETTRDDRIPGPTNAWQLTSLGAQLEAAVRDETPTPERRVAPALPQLDADGLDYRTPQLLRALGEQPGLSTAQAAARAGFADSSAASTLLAGLTRAGLIRSASSPGRRGGAWRLTTAGATLAEELARSTPDRLRSGPLEIMRESGGRLSDRAIAVLRAVGVEPGIGNRGLTVRVGVEPEDDLSPLLASLRDRLLLEHTRDGGGEDAWRLTPSGKRLHHALARETAAPAPGAALDLMLASNVRLNHRSAAMLLLIAREPGLSNAQIALGVGVESTGHASTLLARLARHGLIDRPRRTGRRNAWRLTTDGRRLTATAGCQDPQPSAIRASSAALTASA